VAEAAMGLADEIGTVEAGSCQGRAQPAPRGGGGGAFGFWGGPRNTIRSRWDRREQARVDLGDVEPSLNRSHAKREPAVHQT